MMTGELKMLITRELLAFRRAHQGLVSAGAYEGLSAAGDHADQLLAFRRTGSGDEQAIVLVGRCTTPLGNVPIGGAWADTHLDVGGVHTSWRCLIHGTRIAVASGQIRAGDAFSVLPVAVLTPDNY